MGRTHSSEEYEEVPSVHSSNKNSAKNKKKSGKNFPAALMRQQPQAYASVPTQSLDEEGDGGHDDDASDDDREHDHDLSDHHRSRENGVDDDDDDDDDGDRLPTTSAADPSTERRRRRRRLPPLGGNGNRPAGSVPGLFLCINLAVVATLFVICGGLVFYSWKIRGSANIIQPEGGSSSPVRPSAPSTSSATAAGDGGSSSSASSPHTVHYDPSWTVNDHENSNIMAHDPFDLPHVPAPPLSSETAGDGSADSSLGFYIQPQIVNNSLVFVSQGDAYYTRIDGVTEKKGGNTVLPAMKLTTTVGNVRTPYLSPDGRYLAYTATYTAHRDVYVLDLHTRTRAQRVTYGMDSRHGVLSIAGWKDSGTILVTAYSNVVSLPDLRVYELHLSKSTDDKSAILPNLEVVKTVPVPLAQATEGVFDGEGCFHFTRFKQSSQTVRYVGGTAESLWAWCDGKQRAVALTSNYVGTSKSPSVAEYNKGQSYLLFLSDRGRLGNGGAGEQEWTPKSMNLWAMKLPTKEELYDSGGYKPQKSQASMIQMTHISCQEDGRALKEYSIDPVSKNLVLRVGADMYFLSANDIEKRLSSSMTVTEPKKLNIHAYTDFHDQQERLVSVNAKEHLTSADVFDTGFGTTNVLASMRGQTWVLPVLSRSQDADFSATGQNLPPRRYRVVPGSTTGGSMRVLATQYVPIVKGSDDEDKYSTRRLAVVLATDPLSPTAEHAFYLVEVQADATNAFTAMAAQLALEGDRGLIKPFLGGADGGGSTQDGGLGSVTVDSVSVSPCGRRMAWTDTDGRICVVTLPVYSTSNETSTTSASPPSYKVLPRQNELGEPIDGTSSDLTWSPGGRYLAVRHGAKNQFSIVSIVDCGSPAMPDVKLGRVVQATPSRFNSYDVFWGKSSLDFYLNSKLELLKKATQSTDETSPPDATTLYFLSDRDVMSDVSSPWGTRAPQPHFVQQYMVYALPLEPKQKRDEDSLFGRFAGGGGLEVFVDDIHYFQKALETAIAAAADTNSTNSTSNTVSDRRLLRRTVNEVSKSLRGRRLSRSQSASVHRFLDDAVGITVPSENATAEEIAAAAVKAAAGDDDNPDSDLLDDSDFPTDMDIDFGPEDLSLARKAYHVSRIPAGKYVSILSQTSDAPALVLIEKLTSSYSLKVFELDDFPGDAVDATPISIAGALLADWGLSTTRKYMFLVYAPDGKIRVVPNTVTSLAKFAIDAKGDADENFADTADLTVSIWPSLEYRQMYNDAWRMLRDYFYDANMHGLDWSAVHARYLPLVQRCTKREDLDDVLSQMAAELSALHVFVYGGEYSSPFEGDEAVAALHEPASLGVTLERAPEWKGYRVTEVPERDPDFSVVGGSAVFCPLSDQSLSLTGQKGVQVGDVIVGINGESVLQAPDIYHMLRGMAGRSVRLEILRLASGGSDSEDANEASTEPVITTAISPSDAYNLRYHAWEWRTRQSAKRLAAEAGFSVGYVHLRAMDRAAEHAFARDFFPDYDKQALILDVRHNDGGNIDSWILSFLQRKAWMFWKTRSGYRSGDMDWDEQFAFRGHIVVLIDEHTGSDGEGVSRGMAELGLGRLIGKRTWGGGIWLASDNNLVDGGIATAPEVGTFNNHFAFGLGYENYGVDPDIEVDNEPRSTFDGKDAQLERAIVELKQWLKDEPVVIPNPPDFVKDVSVTEDCPAP